MKKSSLILFSSFLAFAFLVESCKEKQQKQADARPKIVFIMSDDHAYQAIRVYGDSLNHTHNIL